MICLKNYTDAEKAADFSIATTQNRCHNSLKHKPLKNRITHYYTQDELGSVRTNCSFSDNFDFNVFVGTFDFDITFTGSWSDTSTLSSK